MIWLNRRADTVYCVVRLTIGLMFACHGRQKFSVSHQANDGSRAERAGAVVADSEQGRAAGAILFHVFAGGILPPGSLKY